MSLRSETTNPAFRRKIKEEHGNTCANCGSGENIEYHHIVPIFLGGTNKISNIIPLCHKCHQAAHKGRNVSRYKNKSNPGGRKTNKTDDDAYRIFDMYTNGEIGNRKAQELFGYSSRTHVAQLAQFKRYMELKGISEVHNIIDVTATVSSERFKNGCKVRYIVYKDGRRENITYKDTGMNDVKYTPRKL